MDALVLRPFRFAGVDRLVIVATRSPTQRLHDPQSVSRADFQDWQRESTTVKQWAAYEWWDANLSGVDIPEQVPGFRVSPGFFATVGAGLALGRDFAADEAEPGRHRRVVLGHALWTRRFASSPAIVGTTGRLDGEAYEVVGVAPEGFEIPHGAQVWSPFAHAAEGWHDRRLDNLSVIGRLADNATLDAVRAELTTIIDGQRRDHPETNANRLADVMSFTKGMGDPGAESLMVIWQAAAGQQQVGDVGARN